MGTIKFYDDETFSLSNPENFSGLYFPIAGEQGLKSSVTPNLGGDAKLNQNAFLLEPVSIDNLHNNRSVRNVWCHVEGKGAWSAVGASAEEENKKFTDEQDESELLAGYMWHKISRKSKKYELSSEITSFVPMDDDVEIMYIKIKNEASYAQAITPVVAVPIYGRSADNIRDHRHVTSLLHRITTEEYGVFVKPTLSFDERGHKKNTLTYFVCGVSGAGEKPLDFYPAIDTFIGEGGTLTRPEAVVLNKTGMPSGSRLEGKEALGGLHFATVSLNPGASVTYTVVMGVTDDSTGVDNIIKSYDSDKKVCDALNKLKEYWAEKVNVICDTGNKDFDVFMRWVSFQPFLRRIYGCSFLPHHDYGRGGRGWRDLWQDCLSLLIMNPEGVREMVVDNYGGVRIDGTNATIIGEKKGEFIADRNGIARVWMDHGMWPFMTTKLYIDQSGDVDVLKEKVAYFKDEQCMRGCMLDADWNEEYGVCQKDHSGEIYKGTVLEHILLEHLGAFYEVGAHNHIRLRGADWNDALDMAWENGESVAFTCAYAGNLSQLADMLVELEEKYGWQDVELLQEINVLLEPDVSCYDDIAAKKDVLNKYLTACKHSVSGTKINISVKKLAESLYEKAEWIKEHVRNTEWISDGDCGWFNSYYDNHEQAVEGCFEDGVRMMLTGQVFAIMSETANSSQVASICNSADKYLYKKEIGGYRLNTDFHEEKYDLGRMFGFAYGEKENGAVFSHMTVMYANALYKRGFVREGHKALSTLSDHALNFNVSKIYPGIPEYFDASGRGLYHYLTGAASWYLMTLVTEVFGVKGQTGNMVICPKLMKSQFDKNGDAKLKLCFAGKKFDITIQNADLLEYGEYTVKQAVCDGKTPFKVSGDKAALDRAVIDGMGEAVHEIKVILGK